MAGSTIVENGAANPDNNTYDDYRANDVDYNSLGYNSQGGGNRSWYRFGIANQFQLAQDELGWSSERRTRYDDIHIGQKTNYFKSGVSRYNTGSNSTSYIDMGANATGRILRFSTGSESGDPSNERHAWSPDSIYIS